MDSRGTFYRCNLFSFSGPRTEGVISSWKQNLESIAADDQRTESIELETALFLDSWGDVRRISGYAPSQAQTGMFDGLPTESAGALGIGGKVSECYHVR